MKKITGDGNCQNRSISYAVTGSEDNHAQIRGLMYHYMFQLDAKRIRPHLPDNTLKSYENHYRNVGTLRSWGTDVDILAFVSFLNISINVYQPHGTSGNWYWHTYKPDVFSVSVGNVSAGTSIFIKKHEWESLRCRNRH